MHAREARDRPIAERAGGENCEEYDIDKVEEALVVPDVALQGRPGAHDAAQDLLGGLVVAQTVQAGQLRSRQVHRDVVAHVRLLFGQSLPGGAPLFILGTQSPVFCAVPINRRVHLGTEALDVFGSDR